jgi:pimeloyl-ACP methyl ester carboxylesterase
MTVVTTSVDTASQPLGYSLAGPVEGRTLVLLHGVFFGRGTWRLQVDRLAARYQVLTIDLPGHGDLEDRPFSIHAAVDTVEEVLDRLGIESAVVAGLSLGGYVAIEVARRRPALVLALVLSGASAEPSAFLPGPVRGIAGILSHAPRRLSGRISLVAIRVLYGVRVMHVLREARPTIPGGMAALRGLPRIGFAERLASIYRPVLILNGAEDHLVRRQQERFLGATAQGRLVVIGDAGHLAPVEKPDEFAEAVDAFLRMLASDG